MANDNLARKIDDDVYAEARCRHRRDGEGECRSQRSRKPFPARKPSRACREPAGPVCSTSRSSAGLASDHLDFAEAAYRIGQADASTGLVYVMHVGAAQTINLFGNADRRSAG